jgi:hypothetical protein
VEEVWSEFIGPTATLLARRLGRLVELRPGGIEVELSDLASSLGVSNSIARKALTRLDRFGVMCCDFELSVLGVSGYVPPVAGSRLLRLSEAGRIAHDRLMTSASHHEPPGRAAAFLRSHAPPAPVRTMSLDR